MGSCSGAYYDIASSASFYEASASFYEDCRKGIDNIHRRVQPFHQTVVLAVVANLN